MTVEELIAELQEKADMPALLKYDVKFQRDYGRGDSHDVKHLDIHYDSGIIYIITT